MSTNPAPEQATPRPLVGEVTTLRTFRLADDGALLPITGAGGDKAWPSGLAEATCNTGAVHQAPDPNCTCGFYSYGHKDWVESTGVYAWSHLVLGVIECSGRIVVGEKGVRAQNARLIACFIHPSAPEGVVEQFAARYPGVQVYRSKKRLYAEHQTTPMASYIDPSEQSPALRFKKKTSRRERVSLGLHLAIIAVGIIIVLGQVLNTITSTPDRFLLSLMTVGLNLALWVPLCLESVVYLRFRLTPEVMRALRTLTNPGWSPRSSVLREALTRVGVLLLFLPLLVLVETQGVEGTPLATIIGFAFFGGCAAYSARFALKTLPMSKWFPLAVRGKRLKEFAALQAGLAPGAETIMGLAASPTLSLNYVVEGKQLGYAMLNFPVISDPAVKVAEPAQFKQITKTITQYGKQYGLSGLKQWLVLIGSDDDTVRVARPDGIISTPIPLAEVLDVVALPNQFWCPPHLRPAFVALNAETVSTGKEPRWDRPAVVALGYTEDPRTTTTKFADPRIAEAHRVATLVAAQGHLRDFKEITAALPEGLEPIAVPAELGDDLGLPAGREAQAETILTGARLLLDTEATPTPGLYSQVFALVEMVAGLEALGQGGRLVRIRARTQSPGIPPSARRVEAARLGHLFALVTQELPLEGHYLLYEAPDYVEYISLPPGKSPVYARLMVAKSVSAGLPEG